MPVGLLAQPPGGFPIVHDPVSHVENKAMSDRVLNILSRTTAVLTAILGAITTISKFFAAKATVTAMAAANASGAPMGADSFQDLWNAILTGGAGLTAIVVSLVIPMSARFIASKVRGKLKPGFVAGLDRAACETLLQTRHDKADDIAHVTALIESGVKLEVQQRITAATPAAKVA